MKIEGIFKSEQNWQIVVAVGVLAISIMPSIAFAIWIETALKRLSNKLIDGLEKSGHLPKPATSTLFGIKKLEFEVCTEWGGDQRVLVCSTLFGRYEVLKYKKYFVQRREYRPEVQYMFRVIEDLDSEDEAIAAAQADFEKHMREGLVEVSR